MKKTTPFPVSKENFPQCWEYVDNCRRIARRRAAVAKVGGFFSNLFFLLMIVAFVNGLIYNRTSSSYCTYLKTLPYFIPAWEYLSELLLKPGDALHMDLVRLLVADYLASALVFCVFAGLIALVYHPRKIALPESSYPEQTAQLVKQIRKARASASKTKISASPTGTVLAIIAAFVLFFSYAFYLNDSDKINAMLSIFPTNDAATNGMIYVLFGLILSSILCAPLLLMTRFLYRYRISLDMVNQVEQSALLAEEDIASLDEEGRKAMAASLREEAIEQERSHMYHEARKTFLRAAHLGDACAMEHYARHCQIAHEPESARFWLEKCAAAGDASENARKMRNRIKWHRTPDVRFLDNEKKKSHTGIRAVLRFITLLLSIALLVGTCYGGWLMFDSGKNPEKHPKFNQWMDQMRGRVQEEFPELAAQSANAISYYRPTMTLRPTLSWDGHSWDAPSLLDDNNGNPIPVCYTKDIGGDLYIPVRDIWHETAYLYTGAEEEMQDISEHIRYDNDLNMLVAAEDFLLTLVPGEYYIIPEFWDGVNKEFINQFAFGLIVEETSEQCSLLAGLSASGNRDWQFLFDLDDPKDIVLPFHSVGSNPIVGVRRVYLMQTLLSLDPNLEPEYFSVDETGSVVTIKKEYLQQQTLGDHFALELIRKDGRIHDMSYRVIGITQGDNTGIFTLLGPDTHALSKGNDYAAKFEMNNASQVMHLEVSLNGTQLVNADPDHVGSYFDYTTNTLTIPAGKFKVLASPGDTMEIRIAYTLLSYQSVTKTFTVQFTE